MCIDITRCSHCGNTVFNGVGLRATQVTTYPWTIEPSLTYTVLPVLGPCLPPEPPLSPVTLALHLGPWLTLGFLPAGCPADP